jgi:hypothetical protein
MHHVSIASIASWDILSPTLLRTDPGALAAWIRFRFARWVLSAPFEGTPWDHDAARGGERDALVVGSNATAKIALRNGHERVALEVRFPGVGAAIGAAMPHTLARRLPTLSPQFVTSSVWVPRRAGAQGAATFRIADLVTTPSCALIHLGALMGARLTRCDALAPRALLLLGVEPDLRSALHRVVTTTQRLRQLATAPATHATRYAPGFARTGWVPVDRAAPGGGIDLRAIHEDMRDLFARVGFTGGLSVGGVRDVGPRRHEASVHFGEIAHVVHDEGAAPARGTP